MTDGITSLGAGSGLDLASLVEQLVGAERQSRESRLIGSEARALSQLSAFGQIKGAVSAFQTRLEPLQDLSSFRGRSASTEDDTLFTATANENAATGRYAIEVVALAESQKLRTDAFDSSVEALGTGNIAFSSGENSFSIAIDDEANSLADIRDAINASPDNKVLTAGIVNSVDGAHLVLTSTEAGKGSAFNISVSGGDGGLTSLAYNGEDPSAFSEINAAADAQLRIDGLDITASSNVVTNAIEGVSIDLLAATDGAAFDLNVNFDQDAAKAQVEQFVQGYNNVLLTVGNQTTFNSETFQSGPLFGDSAVRSLVSDAREVVNGVTLNSASGFSSLAQIGITTEIDGTLKIDDAALTAALETDFEDVGLLFAGSDDSADGTSDGMSARLNDLLGGYLEPAGRLTTRTDSLESRVEDFSDQREALNRRMESFEARIRRQFTSLDTLLSELNNTSTFLAQQLESLPGSGSN